MKPFFVLITAFIITLVVSAVFGKTINYLLAGRVAMASMLLFTAIGHFAFAKGMSAMIPDAIPYKIQLTYITGVMEILFAAGLLLPSFQKFTGWILVVFLLLVLPANIKSALDHLNYQTGEYNGPGIGYLWFRIPLQLLFIAWTVWCSGISKLGG